MSEHAVTRTVLIDAPPEEVWAAMIVPARLEEWFADEVEADELAPDVEVLFRWEDGCERHGVIEDVQAPRRLSLRWSALDGAESHVAFELVEEGDGTRVTVIESGPTALSVDGRSAGGPVAWGPCLETLGLSARAILA